MIIETRYRDIPWEDVKPCISHASGMTETIWTKERRSRPVKIKVPASGKGFPGFACNGPFFRVYPERKNPSGRWRSVCPHIAEIGD